MTGAEVARAIIVDDEPAARELLLELLADIPEVEVMGAYGDALEATEAVARMEPDILFLDVQLSHRTGFEVLDSLGKRSSPAVVFVTAYDEYAIKAFEVAAVDYLLKPFDGRRLRQAVSRAIDRSRLEAGRTPRVSVPAGTAESESIVMFGAVTVNRAAHVVRRDGREILLRPMEYKLLLALLDRPGVVASRDVLLNEVWGYRPDVTTRTLDIHIKELRRKLEMNPAAPRHIVTVRTIGYRFDP